MLRFSEPRYPFPPLIFLCGGAPGNDRLCSSKTPISPRCRALARAQDRVKEHCRPTVHEMMFFMNLWALGFLTVSVYASGQWDEGMIYCVENPVVMVRASPSLYLVPVHALRSRVSLTSVYLASFYA